MARKREFNLETLFIALGDRTRLRLLNLMGGRETCVCYFIEVLGLPQPKISRHLAYLRKAGIVEARRDGKWMHYRIVMPQHVGAAKILLDTLEALKDERDMRADAAKMTKACCSLNLEGVPEGAPMPTAITVSAEPARR